MAYVAAIQPNPDYVTIVLNYRAPKTGVLVYVVSDANAWVPEEMTPRKDTPTDAHDAVFERALHVPRGMQSILYKFRVGDGQWGFDPNAPTENDGFCGANNRFDIPSDLPPTPPPDALVESIDELTSSKHPDPEANHTALPSPAATPRDTTTDYDVDSGTEVEAPSVSDWEPTEEAERSSQFDGASEPEILPPSPTPSCHASQEGAYSMSENADWIVL